MITVDFSGIKAKLESGTWTSSDADLAELLNEWTGNEIKTAAIDSPFFTLYSPSTPYPDMTIAQEAAKAWNGEIMNEGEAPEHNPDVIY